ncbi:FGGY-family carbohydrate kinase [Roseobacter sp. OBYS 0001]|uniref:xylulokinase n=1 Tax=Roseobacter sp. OBYS 0001 TaxID=882651 RepID=UPI001BC45486|nr:FGGY-family carbohydrate kinase [Roseobacter sp. OBYS 0001]GIT88795.1 xylulokinase [Roseobacter sp. OBYS 0001]
MTEHPEIKDCVIGIDSSTTATKAIAWTREGKFVAEGRCPIALSNPKPGHFEQDAQYWWLSTKEALREVTGQIDARRVAAVAVSNQRETFCVFGADEKPLLPGSLWLDERATGQQRSFAAKYGAEKIRALSGKPVDVIVPIYRMLWIAENHPDIYARIRHFADVNCFITRNLTGRWATSLASADPMGMVDMKHGCWSHELLDAAGIDAAILPDLYRPGAVIGPLTAQAAEATGLPAGIPVVAGGGDGQCAATGTGTVEPGIAYMNLGTALVAGCYSPEYAHSQAFRTEIAVSGEGYIYETLLKAGTFLIDWMTEQLAQVRKEDQTAFLNALEKEAQQSPIGANGLIVLPYWQGSMTPNWDSDARGVIAGLSGSTQTGDIYRAILEGLALDTALAFDKAREATGRRLNKVVAIGGGSSSDLFLSIMADALNVEVLQSDVREASSLGAGMAAAHGAGWYPTLSEASLAMKGEIVKTVQPNPERVKRYEALRGHYEKLWPLLSDWNAGLRKFTEEQQ